MQRNTARLRKRWLGLLILIVILAVGAVLFTRWNIDQLVSHPDPVNSYEAAVGRIQVLKAGEANLNPACRTRFLTHGTQTGNIIVFVHGYTTCPQQFAELGNRFFELGFNVLVVPLPYHGLADRMAEAHAHIKAEELVVYADTVVDIAKGLGRRVVIAGISLGGVISAWAGQNRSEVGLAVVISPGFSFHAIPRWLKTPVQNIFSRLPPTLDWWVPELEEKGGPSYAYPRYSKHTLGEIMRLGFAIEAQARRAAPLAKSILVVTNANDLAVDNGAARHMIHIWRTMGGNLATYELAANLNIGHDLIDPNDQDGKIELVYPLLIDLVKSSQKQNPPDGGTL